MKSKFKVGLLTMHRVVNYGSFLQAYATQTIIENLGYDCEIIDYKYPNEWQFERGAIRRSGLKRAIHTCLKPFGLLAEHRKETKLLKTMKKYYNLSEKSYESPQEIMDNPPQYDIYLTGSDQTWNPRFTKGDPTFLLGFVNNHARKISFSSSLAANKIDDKYFTEFSELLSKYSKISVRETNGIGLIENIVKRTPPVTLDPTLVLTKNDWKNLSGSIKKRLVSNDYILFYMLSYAFEPRPYIYQLLKYWQDKMGLKVMSFTVIPKEFNIDYDLCSDVGVEEYLHLFEFSSLVITSSFHGTAFAVNFGIPLLSVVSNENSGDDRQISFLNKVDLKNCIIPVGKDFLSIEPNYNNTKAWRSLDILREDSLNYLSKSLSSSHV